MFWNDPILYGASFPYRDIPTPVQSPLAGPAYLPWQNVPQTPFAGPALLPWQNVPQTPFAGPALLPWQNMPRFVPPFYGFQGLQPPYGYGYMNPYLHTTAFTPFVQPFNYQLPQFNLSQLGWNRPFTG